MASASLPPDFRLAITMSGCQGRSSRAGVMLVVESPAPSLTWQPRGARLSSEDEEAREDRCRPADGDLVITGGEKTKWGQWWGNKLVKMITGKNDTERALSIWMKWTHQFCDRISFRVAWGRWGREEWCSGGNGRDRSFARPERCSHRGRFSRTRHSASHWDPRLDRRRRGISSIWLWMRIVSVWSSEIVKVYTARVTVKVQIL